jgi:AraC-like DNA-binding protein
MPGLPGPAFGLDEQHRLHGLDVGADELGQGDDDRMGQCPAHQLGQFVGEVDAQAAADQELVGLIGLWRLDAVDGPELAAADVHGLLPQGPHLLRPPCLVAAGTDPAVVLQELAAGASISTGYLSRVVRQHYGIGPVAAFELLRLARAATLLVRSNLSVATVAHDCGFANPYHFSRRCHHRYGQPPGRYRHAPERRQPAEPSHRQDCSPSTTTSGGRPDNHSSRSG